MFSGICLAAVGASASLRAQSLFDLLPGVVVPSVAAGGTGGFTPPLLATGDFNGDGLPDVLVRRNDLSTSNGPGGRRVLIGLNDGACGFRYQLVQTLSADDRSTTDIAVFDFDGDGDDDLVFVNDSSFNPRGLAPDLSTEVFRNESPSVGALQFALQPGAIDPNHLGESRAVSVADVDRDGDLDLFVGQRDPIGVGEPHRLYLNDGQGQFVDVTAGSLPAGPLSSISGAVLADVDGDGDPDLVTTESPNAPGVTSRAIYLNDGLGNFVVGQSIAPVLRTPNDRASVGDLDDDGDPDLLLGLELWENDGNGTFSFVSLGSGLIEPQGLADLDGDGRLDVFGSTRPGSMSTTATGIARRVGPFQFEEVSSAFLSEAVFSFVRLPLDFDADGDIDLLEMDGLFARPLINLSSQLDAPLAPRVGSVYLLDTYARDAALSQPSVVTVLSGAPGLVPLGAIGDLLLSPLSAIVLPPVPIPAATGLATRVLPVPADPNLRGVRLFSQSVLFDGLSAVRVTNRVDDSIR